MTSAGAEQAETQVADDQHDEEGLGGDAIIDSGDAELHLLVPVENTNYYIHDIDSALRIQNWKLRFRRRLFVSYLGLSHARWQDEWIDQCEVFKATSDAEVLVNRGKPSLRARGCSMH